MWRSPYLRAEDEVPKDISVMPHPSISDLRVLFFDKSQTNRQRPIVILHGRWIQWRRPGLQ